MEAYEAAFLEATLDDGGASIATCMREESGKLVSGPERLTADGQQWLRGYLAGQLSMVRGSTVGNPSLSADDLDRVATLADERSGTIAAELYA